MFQKMNTYEQPINLLEKLKHTPENIDREFLLNVARTSLKTKLIPELANQ